LGAVPTVDSDGSSDSDHSDRGDDDGDADGAGADGDEDDDGDDDGSPRPRATERAGKAAANNAEGKLNDEEGEAREEGIDVGDWVGLFNGLTSKKNAKLIARGMIHSDTVTMADKKYWGNLKVTKSRAVVALTDIVDATQELALSPAGGKEKCFMSNLLREGSSRLNQPDVKVLTPWKWLVFFATTRYLVTMKRLLIEQRAWQI